MTELSLQSRPMPARRSALLTALFGKLDCGTLEIQTPGGTRLRFGGNQAGPLAVLQINRWRAVGRLVSGGDVGFAAAFIDGEWTSPDLPTFIELIARNRDALTRVLAGNRFFRAINRLYHRTRANTPKGSRRNIEAHYDLGNDFYAHWLDAGMNYSSALYAAAGMTLEQAQIAKLDRVLEMLDPAVGDRVLEIGIGWGSMAQRLVTAGCEVTGLTLSPAQLSYAATRVEGAPAELLLRDYRDQHGQFDRVVSIEMLEAVGEDYWPTYFAKLKNCLAKEGRVVLQVITIASDLFESYKGSPDFIQRYVFPGGMLPTMDHIVTHAARAGLRVAQTQFFGHDYARTLAEWRRRFDAAWPQIATLGFPPHFQRLWQYYLSYCEAGFRADSLDVGLWQLEHADFEAA